MALKKTDGPAMKDIKEERHTGYFFGDKEITTGKRRGRPPTRKVSQPGWYPMDRKVEACTLYAVYGDFAKVSKDTEIPENILRAWKNENWWLEITKQVYVEQNEGLASKISTILDKSLNEIMDRLENGDLEVARGGQLVRRPVASKELAMLFKSLGHERRLTRGEPTAISKSIGVDDRLKTLKESFEKFAKTRLIDGEVVDESKTDA